ncbi:MAG: DUF4249 family protein [Saprospiraceae bacterium]|nr:DUF4249 family protein [Saprospiraceae bacterium]
MNRLLGLLLVFGILIWNGCSNDLELTTDYKDIPVIYAKLDASDSAHYIRVEKAFLDPKTNAFVLAQRVDSLYYPNAVVTLEKNDDGTIYTLERVDGNLEGYVRDTGIFASAPNYLYKIRQDVINLEGEDEVKITLKRGENFADITSTSTIIPPMEIDRPFSSPINVWENLAVQWTRNSELPRIFDLSVIVRYQEKAANDPNAPVFNREIEWLTTKNLTLDPEENNAKVTYRIDGDAFFSFLGNNLSKDEPVVRQLSNISFKIFGGDSQIENAYLIALANQGFASTQDPPVYTNIEGGRGIFASVTSVESIGFTLAASARDSLLNGRFTSGLGFQ